MLHALARDTGEVLWSHDLITDMGGEVLDFGYSASPILHDGDILVPMGGNHSIVAMDPEDGSTQWQSGPRGISYSTPLVIDVDGQQQVVFFSGVEVIGIEAGDGRELWSFPAKNQYSNNATNLHWQEGNLLWVASQLDGGTRVLHLTRGEDATSVEEVWSSNKMSIHHWNTVLVDGHIYGSFGGQGNILQSIELATGNVLWRERGFSKVNGIHADGKLIFLGEKGELGLARVSPQKIEVLSRAQVATEEAWSAPALAGSVLYVRDNKTILALDLGA
jgi:outer membrane protein assembly factor BamB